ncbi:MAG: type I-C CRISPR-associated protein Cas8c/Csd1 [Eubacteriales bacterium]|nr:type I-C CRISPR-associated protein Cas8c/Csd1 [Eubacteriales bacterium]
MSVLTNLLKAYETMEQMGKVGKCHGNDTVLLPIYHNSIRANKNNVVDLCIDTNGNVVQASFPDESKFIFPVTEDSVARSSGIAPHPLMDSAKYIIASIAYPRYHAAYLQELNAFFEQVNSGEVKSFLQSIINFVANTKNLAQIVACLFNAENTEIHGAIVKYINEKGKNAEFDFSDVFIVFSVVDAFGEIVEASRYKALQQAFIQYINSQADVNVGVCNISGQLEPLTEKHRGLLGMAKVISVSNNKETYFGRFKTGSDIIKIGRKSSDKIHLMLKYFLENDNSKRWLGDSLYLINWFSDDIENQNAFDLQSVVSGENSEIGNLFVNPSKSLPYIDESYYAMLVDKSSKGRISIRYYKQLQKSQLLQNVLNWQKNYVWEVFNKEKKSYVPWIPSLYYILYTAYGIEQNEKLEIGKEKFAKDQFQNIIVSILENKPLPTNIVNALSQNIRNRQKYDTQWNSVVRVALAILSKNHKENMFMREEAKQTRSYLYGRLLAIYEKVENDVLKVKNTGGDIRSSNASRLWNAYVNKPNATMMTLEMKTKSYENTMAASKELRGYYYKLHKAKADIFRLLEEMADARSNAPLDDDFIFGYYAQTKDFYTKKENENE